jgi:hypothetical protein
MDCLFEQEIKKGVKISDVVDYTIKGLEQQNTGKISNGKPVYFFRVDHHTQIGNQNFEKNLKHAITKAIMDVKHEYSFDFISKTEIRVYNNLEDKNPDLTLTVSWLQRETKKPRFSIIEKIDEHRRTIVVDKNNKKTLFIVGNWIIDK